MRLLFDLPDGWTSRREGEHVLVQRGAFGSRIEGAPLVPKGFDPLAVIEAKRPRDSRVEYVQLLEALETRTGFRMKLVTLRVLAQTSEIETRIAAVYDITHYLGIAVGYLVADDDRRA